MPKAKAAARKALEIDDHLAEAHTSLAFVNLRYEYDWTAAEEGFQRAIQLDPSYATAHRWYFFYLAAMGRFEEGIEEMKRAQELEPLSLIIGSNLGAAYLFARKYDQAIEEIEKTLEIDPTFYRGLGWLGLAYQQKGMHEQSIACFQKYRQLDSSARGLAQLGQAYAAAGKRAEAGKVLEELRRLSPKRVVPPYHVAAIHAALGDSDRAFEWLEKAYEERSEYLIWIKVHPMMESLRSDPRFQDLLKKMNLAS
jgi:tetratricopeptide (TPR) repeat protein